MLFNRIILNKLKKSLANESKVIILYGPRQAGKTTLIKDLMTKLNVTNTFYDGDDLYTQRIFSRNELAVLKKEIGNNQLIIIDEAQRVENIGLVMKLIVDNLSVQIIASGSSSFELANRVSEPLTGRSQTFWLYPLSYSEIQSVFKKVLPETALEQMLIYGMFPRVCALQNNKDKQNYLFEYESKYLYKDILSFNKIRKPKKVMDLLTLLALQIGQEVSISELAQNLDMSQKAVNNYLDILEKMFIIYNLRGFSRNLRKEIYKTSKYYFVDLGVRNAVIRNFNPLKIRNDVGVMFENWFIMEKIKRSVYNRDFAKFYFWRTYDQKEIDLIEDNNGELIGYECKWSIKKQPTAPIDWQKAYPTSTFELINPLNYAKFLE